MSRPARQGAVLSKRERLKLETARAAQLREIYPQLALIHIEFDFEDGTPRKPSPQSYSYFPAARGFFRYSCPCHACSGEFDLSAQVAELAGKTGLAKRSRSMTMSCAGHRTRDPGADPACPVCAQIRVSAVPHTPEQST